MRFALISCVHANLAALEAVLRDAQQSRCDSIFCLGDIVGYYESPNECVDLIRAHCQASVKGNHDEYCSGSCPLSDFNPKMAEVIELTRAELSPTNKRWLKELPYVLGFDDFTMVHSCLDTPERWQYIFDKFAAAVHFTKQSTPLCFIGHTHIPVAFRHDGSKLIGGTFMSFSIQPGSKYLVNVGSVGQPRDGQTKATYVIYDAGDRMVELRRVDYPRPGGYGVGRPVPTGGGPPKTLKAQSNYPEDDNRTIS